MDTILVTGATGFLGSNLISRLSTEGYRLIALSRNKEGWHKLINKARGRKNLEYVELIQGDITRPLLGLSGRRFRRLAWQVDTIIHCAALTDFENEERLFRTNVEGTGLLLQFALLGRKKHFHHVSSAYVAGNYNGTFYEEDFNKNQSFNNSYEESKFNAEFLIRRFARKHLLPYTVYRPSIIVGDSTAGHTECYKGFYAFARALFLLKLRALEGDKSDAERMNIVGPKFGPKSCGRSPRHRDVSVKIPMKLFGDPEGLINLVPVDYVVGAICEIFKRPEAHNKTFHLTNPYPLSLIQLTNKVLHVLGIEGVKLCHPHTEAYEGTNLGCNTQRTYDNYGRISPTERFLLHYTKPYLPYLESRLSFDCSNTKNALNGSVTCPKITTSLISLLIDKAIENHWGMESEGQHIPESTYSSTHAVTSCV